MNETKTVNSAFGTIRLEYIPAYTDVFDEHTPASWKATLVDGSYSGRDEAGVVESVAIKKLILSVAKSHAADVVDILDGVDTTFTGGPED